MAIGVALPAITTHIASIIAAACCVGGTFMVVTMLGIETARASSVQPRKLIAAMTKLPQTTLDATLTRMVKKELIHRKPGNGAAVRGRYGHGPAPE